MLNHLSAIQVHISGRYHVHNGEPLYPQRFLNVLKFHEPGLAPVVDMSGAYHINLSGLPVYPERYKSTFGFYCRRAAVENKANEWFHILPDGEKAYAQTYAWCGNFQEDKAPVQQQNGLYYHIDLDGRAVYHEQYCYVGDYKDGIAVVKNLNGKSTHIDADGHVFHGYWYDDLDVYHKGYARARDTNGWFHITLDGLPAYAQRYANIEPFYNGVAFGLTHDQTQVLVGEQGEIQRYLTKPDVSILNKVSGQMTQYWLSFALMHFLHLDILTELPASLACVSEKKRIPIENLKRLLEVIVDVGYLTLDGDLISFTDRGQQLSELAFLTDAATMWMKVAEAWTEGLRTLQVINGSFLGFKATEPNPEAAHAYHRALIGYATHNVPSLSALQFCANSAPQKVLVVGRQGLPLVENLQKIYQTSDIFVYVQRWNNEPLEQASFQHGHLNFLDDLKDWPQDSFDAMYFVKELMHYDDQDAERILSLATRHLNPNGEIYVLEPVKDAHDSMSGLNLNMLLECGGKLRSHHDWMQLSSIFELEVVLIREGFNTIGVQLLPKEGLNNELE